MPSSGFAQSLMRVLAAAVLAPLAIAIAYAGGWLWAALVTLAAIGLYVEWLMIVGLAAPTRVVVPGVVALAVGRALPRDRRGSMPRSIVLAHRPRRGRIDRAGAAQLGGGGISLCRGGARSPRCWCGSIPSRASPR